MFFEGDRIIAVREMILADDAEGRRAALGEDPAVPAVRTSSSCSRSCRACRSRSACSTRRSHEFLPHTDAEVAEVGRRSGVAEEKIRHRMRELSEHNPMLGFRGVVGSRSPFRRSPRCRPGRSSRPPSRRPRIPARR
ncbi:hypothetical protein ACU4GA_02720 [Methylobacterium oryzae CBMB20]